MDRPLTEAELAKRWGISPRTLQLWRREGKGCPFITIGNHTIRYRMEDVLAYEKKRLATKGGA